MGNDNTRLVLVVENSLKALNLHFKGCGALQLEYGTKTMNKHKFNNYIGIK